MATTTVTEGTATAPTTTTSSASTTTMTCLTPNLGVKHVPSTIKFYTEKLGFKLTCTHPPSSSKEEPVWASLEFGDKVKIMISTQTSMENEYIDTKTHHLGGGFTLYYTVNDCDIYCQELKGKDVELLKEPEDMFYGMREFSIKDIDGYVLTFGSMIKGFNPDMMDKDATKMESSAKNE